MFSTKVVVASVVTHLLDARAYNKDRSVRRREAPEEDYAIFLHSKK